jgi:hypothetical protein
MIPCPRLPLFVYGPLKTPIKTVVLAGKIEGAMEGRLPSFKVVENDTIIKTEDTTEGIIGEILWINLQRYDELISTLDSYITNGKNELEYMRIACEPLTNEPVYRAIAPTAIKCWTYQKHHKIKHSQATSILN